MKLKQNEGKVDIIIVFLGGLMFLLLCVVGLDFSKSVIEGNGWISQDRNGEAFKEILREENDCIYYINVWDSESKICGSYKVNRYK